MRKLHPGITAKKVEKQYGNQSFIDNINKRIAEIREQKRIVQEDIVDRTEFTQKQVWNILSGINNTSVSSIEAVSNALEIHRGNYLNLTLK
ncbi:MAG: DNA-binding protein [Mucilaginibacter sp.]|nr:DNA-binding protein [Mucilaginibacter sp.]